MRKLLYRYILLILALVTVAPATADFKTVLTHLPKGGVLKAKFTQKRYLSGIPQPIKSTGDIILWNGKGLLWNTVEPFANTILLTAQGIFQVENGQKTSLTANQGNHNQKVLLDLISHILNGSFEDIEQFKAEPLAALAPSQWKVRLLPPQNIKSFISSIIVEGGSYITGITINRSNADKDEITLTQHTLINSQDVNKVINAPMRRLFNG